MECLHKFCCPLGIDVCIVFIDKASRWFYCSRSAILALLLILSPAFFPVSILSISFKSTSIRFSFVSERDEW